ncbi:S9 family peptidase [Pirellulaceae bacterium]|jgi:dipeptidyl aminopeptidase/acylaminoacyl peptidase|nr:S9 family peptidase [Pirellulaceae bacterium]
MSCRHLFVVFASVLMFFGSADAQPQKMTPELLWKLGRLGSSTVSPDEKIIAYSVRRYDLKENTGRSTICVKILDRGTTITPVSDWKVIGALDWIESGGEQQLLFEGFRGDEKNAAVQAWMLRLSDLKLTKLTDFEDGVANLKVSPTGEHLAFTRDVKLDSTVNELFQDLPKADARIIDSLMFRHWNQWHDYKYSHLHVVSIQPDGSTGEPVDLMPGVRADCPVPPFGGSEQFNWSPDGKHIAYTLKAVKKWAESTDSDVYEISASGGKPKNLTAGRKGYDNDPVYSPDGKSIAFSSMPRAGFEADRNHIMVYDRTTGSITDATESLDQTVHGKQFLPGGGYAYSSEHRGTNQIFRTRPKGESKEATLGKQLSKGWFNFSLVHVMQDGKSALVSYMSMLRPRELGMVDFATGELTPVTDINGDIYKDLQLPKIEERWVEATDGKKIHCWVIYPPNFNPNKKWPLLLYCQGGPQGQIGQWFSFRWNFNLMASKGYVIVAPNRRGLPGFGQAWNDQISGDWGGQAMKDLLSATESMSSEKYIDTKKIGAIGASFGGYTVYWMMGNAADKFACMIAHCGVFNLESMYGSTEELFFVNWDLGGPYWKGGEIQKEYNQFSPHRFVKNWKTPLFVIHGEKDFRVPVTQGMEAFTAAQVQGVESRFLYFPEEGHWVLGPQNGVLWHRLFFDWLDRYLK